MTKHRSRKSRSSSKSRTMRRGQKGGDLNGNPPSAWGWGMGTLGGGWTQFMNSLTLQPGENVATQSGNLSVPVGNLNAMNTQGMIGSNLKGDIPGSQSGGKKRRHHKRNKKSCKRGGNILAIAEQAAAPLALIALNDYYGKSSRRRRRHS